MATYKNPWHKPFALEYGPEFYETDAKPITHGDCLIYERIKGKCWDVVRNGVCLTQRAGLSGAREAIEVCL